MGKLKIRIEPDATVEDIEKAINDILDSGQKEIELNLIIKIVESLGGVYLTGKKGGTGSGKRFRHELLVGVGGYEDGVFRVDAIHGGKGNVKIRLEDIKRHLFPHLLKIIAIKKSSEQRNVT